MAAVGATTNVNVLIQAKDQASQVVRNIANNVQQSTSRMTKAFDVFKQAGSVAAGMLMRDFAQGATRAISDSFTLGAQLQTLTKAFEASKNAAGATALSLEGLREATSGTVSDVKLLQAANTMLALGLPTDRLEELAGAAVNLGRAMGIDASFAIESVSKGIGRQSKLILDNLGIVFSASDAYEWYAEKIGVSASQLDDSQKKLAWQSYAIEQVIARSNELGNVVSEATLQQERFAASMENSTASMGAALGPLAQFKPAFDMLSPVITAVAMVAIPQFISAITTAGVVTQVTSKLISAAIYGIPIIGWIAAAVTAIVGFYMAWQNNWLGIRDVLTGVADWIYSKIGWLIDGIVAAAKVIGDTLGQVANFFGGLASAVGEAIGAVTETVSAGAQQNAEAMEQGTQRMVVATENLQAALPPIVSDMFGAIKDATLEFTGTTEQYYQAWADGQIAIVEQNYQQQVQTITEEMNATKAEIEASMNEQLATVQQSLDSQLAAIEEHYAKAKEDRTAAYEDEKQSTIDFWMNQIQQTVEGFDKVVAEYEKYYDQQIQTAQRSLNEQLQELQRHTDEELRTTTEHYNQVIAETNAFYDEMLGVYTTQLQNIREARKEDLADLELNYLLQKQAMEQAFNEGKMSAEEYEKAITELTKNYREQRNEINESYRIQELQAEKELSTAEEQIEQERSQKLTQINQEREQKIAEIQQQASQQEQQLRQQTAEVVKRLEEEKKNTITQIREDERRINEAYQNDMAALEQRKSAERTNAIQAAELQKQQIITSARQQMEAVERETQTRITDLTRQKEAEKEAIMRDAQNRMKASHDSFFGDIGRRASEGLSSLSSNFSNAFSNIQNAVSNALSSAGKALSNFTSSLSNAVSGGIDAINNFINSICFAHAINEAVDSSMKDLKQWRSYLEESMKDGVKSIKSFTSADLDGIAKSHIGTAPGLGPGSAGTVIQISGPIVNIEGNADRATAELASKLVLKELSKIVGV